MMIQLYALGWCFLAGLLSVRVTAASSLRTSASSQNDVHDDDNDIVCQVFQTFEEEEDGSDKEFLSCELVFPEVAGTYELPPLPEKLMDQLAEPLLHAEPVFIAIPYGAFTADSIIVPDPHKVTLHAPTERHLQRSRELSRPSPFGGTLAVMVRVSTLDAEPDFSAQQLRDYLFQMDRPSPKRQFEECSVHQTTLIEPSWGVLDVQVDVNLADTTFRALPNLAEGIINTQIKPNGITNIRGHSDVILFVLPAGTGGWAAYATINGKMSVYNNNWGGYMGAVMHELGHNFGIRHSFKDDKQYHGSTGYMGYQPAVPETPQRCYSAHGHFILNWYAFYTIDIGTSVSSTSLEVAAFIDTEMLTPSTNMVVIGKSGDLYWQYNRKDKFNSETGEYPDQLVVWRNRIEGKGGTDLLGGVSVGQQATFMTNDDVGINFQVCSQRTGTSQTPSSVVVTVGTGTLSCPQPTTPAPTTLAPIASPTTFKPTTQPSVNPTTSEPSSQPTTLPPSAYPTLSPSTVEPSLAPITDEPTSGPTFQPSTQAPSPRPSSTPTTSSPTQFLHPTHAPTVSQAPTTSQPSNAPITMSPSSAPVLPTTSPSTISPTVNDLTGNGGVVLILAPSESPSITVLPTASSQPSTTPSVSPRPTFSPTVSSSPTLSNVPSFKASVSSNPTIIEVDGGSFADVLGATTNGNTAAVASSLGIFAIVLIGGIVAWKRRRGATGESYAAFENDDGGAFHKAIVRLSDWTTSSCTTGTLHSDRSLRSCSSFDASFDDHFSDKRSDMGDEAGLSTIPEQWGRPATPSKIFGLQPSWQVFHENESDLDFGQQHDENLSYVIDP